LAYSTIVGRKFPIFITGEIMLEYEEVLKDKYSVDVANSFLTALKELPNVYFTHVYF